MDQSVMLKKNDIDTKSEANLPIFNLAQKGLLKKPVNNMPRASNMEILKK